MTRRKKRRDSWGSITEVERGKKYRIRYWGNDANGSYRRMTCTVRGTRMDAEKRRSELMLAHSEEAPCPTIAEAWERWMLPAYERRVEGGDMSKQSLRQFRSYWRKHAEGRWGDIPCDGVKPLAVQQWLDGMTLGGANGALIVLRPTLDHAVRYGLVESNPFREKYVMPPKSTVATMDKGVWTYDEIGELWRRCAYGKWWEAAFIALAFGGLRVGEALGLRDSDIGEVIVDGIAVPTVSVIRQVPSRGAKTTERLKNPQSRRVVAVPGRAGRRMLELVGTTGGWFSGDGLGNPSTQIRLSGNWNRTLDETDGIERHPIRNLRNSFETNARWVLGVPPWILEPILGHKGQGVTGSYYDRPSDDMLATALARAYFDKQFDAGWSWLD